MAITLDGSNGITTDIASNESATFNRDTTDGDIIILQKDNALVGDIGAEGGDLTIDGSASHSGLRFYLDHIAPRLNGSNSDGGIDLGQATRRFQDLYLSGGVYLGGTTSTNYLDDYEEGTFTPTFTSSGGTLSVGYSAQTGRYTKIGRMVHVTVDIQASGAQSGGTGDVLVSGLPFNFKSTPQLHPGSVGFSNNWGSDRAPSHISGEASSNSARLRRFATLSEVNTGVLATDLVTSSRVYFQITYETD